MKPINVLPSLLFLLILFDEAQGIRLGNGMMQPLELLENALDKKIPLVAEGCSKSTLSKNEHSNSGTNRKLMIATSPSSPSPSTTRNEDEGKKKDKPMLKAKDNLNNNNNNTNNLEAGLDEHYPDLIDIAEMDYSPANRKPPIHN